MVLLHGVGLRSESWRNLIGLLQGKFSIYAIDLPGHGQSQGLTSETLTLENYSDSIAAYLKSFQTPIYLIGHSMGALIALDIAIRFPTLVKGVAALNTIYQRSDKAAKAVQTRAAALMDLSQNDLNTDVTLTRWFGDSPSGDALIAAQSCKAWLHETPISEYRNAYHIFAHHDGVRPQQLAQLNIPALFITGADEPNSTPQMSRDMAKRALMGTAKIISGAAHMMPMTHAPELANILEEHFTEETSG